MNTSKELLSTIREAMEQAQKLAYIANHPGEFKYAEAAGQARRVNDCSTKALSALDRLEAQQHPRWLTDEEIERIAEVVPPPSKAKTYAEFCAEGSGFERGLRYARDNGYIGGLSVEEAMNAVEDSITDERVGDFNYEKLDRDNLRSSLTAKLQGK